jgi:4-hydroxy-L-threonine phosphate dehydrogenase PdxA
MLLVGDAMKVALATTHLPLAQVSAAITSALLDETLVIVDRDLLTIPEDQIMKTKVDYTITGGKIVYSSLK